MTHIQFLIVTYIWKHPGCSKKQAILSSMEGEDCSRPDYARVDRLIDRGWVSCDIDPSKGGRIHEYKLCLTREGKEAHVRHALGRTEPEQSSRR